MQTNKALGLEAMAFLFILMIWLLYSIIKLFAVRMLRSKTAPFRVYGNLALVKEPGILKEKRSKQRTDVN
jgi:hypothetical protein